MSNYSEILYTIVPQVCDYIDALIQPTIALNMILLAISLVLATYLIFCNRGSPHMDRETKDKFMMMRAMTNSLEAIRDLSSDDKAAIVMSTSKEIFMGNKADQ